MRDWEENIECLVQDFYAENLYVCECKTAQDTMYHFSLIMTNYDYEGRLSDDDDDDDDDDGDDDDDDGCFLVANIHKNCHEHIYKHTNARTRTHTHTY